MKDQIVAEYWLQEICLYIQARVIFHIFEPNLHLCLPITSYYWLIFQTYVPEFNLRNLFRRYTNYDSDIGIAY